MSNENVFRQLDDPEPLKLSPIFRVTKAVECGDCGEPVKGLARWRWYSYTEKATVHAQCVDLNEWTHKLTAGTALTWPRGARQSVGEIGFEFHWDDWTTESHGKGYHEAYVEEREEAEDVDYVEQESRDHVTAA